MNKGAPVKVLECYSTSDIRRSIQWRRHRQWNEFLISASPYGILLAVVDEHAAQSRQRMARPLQLRQRVGSNEDATAPPELFA
jgi:hypothetical protein